MHYTHSRAEGFGVEIGIVQLCSNVYIMFSFGSDGFKTLVLKFDPTIWVFVVNNRPYQSSSFPVEKISEKDWAVCQALFMPNNDAFINKINWS